MPPLFWTLTAVFGFLALASVQAAADEQPDPLFRGNTPVDVRLLSPLTTILRERESGEEFDGKLQFVDESGVPVEIDVAVRTRGRFRLQDDICRFPPLRLNFKNKQTQGSLFENQDKVKLVTHCKDKSRRYQQSMLREYVAYRILNELTDVSFRVRLLRITYVDQDGRRPERTEYGFVIEDSERMARRLGLDEMDLAATRPSALQPEHLNLVSLFQYLIGNTDFSPVKGSDGTCCHNHVLIGREDGVLYSVPYDFDHAGLVDAPYAGPNPRFRLRNVRQRLYRGRCANNAQIDATIARFMEKRGTILALVDEPPDLTDRVRSTMQKYIESFYETIGSPQLVERDLIKKCI